MNTLISLLIFVIILGIIFWIMKTIGLPPPFDKIALVIIALIALLYLLSMLGALPGLNFPRLQ